MSERKYPGRSGRKYRGQNEGSRKCLDWNMPGNQSTSQTHQGSMIRQMDECKNRNTKQAV